MYKTSFDTQLNIHIFESTSWKAIPRDDNMKPLLNNKTVIGKNIPKK
jgi:hypothetical protein